MPDSTTAIKQATEKQKKISRVADNDKAIKNLKKNDDEALKRGKYRLYREEMIDRFKVAYDSRRRYDWDWLVRDLYRRGYQFSRYNPANRTVILSSRSQVKIPINLVWAQLRAIKNQVTSFRPKWEVMPSGIGEEAIQNAIYSNKLLDYYYDRLNLRKKIKETVMQGLIYSVGGPWQIGYDANADNGNGEVFIWLIDPYDFFIDPQATSLEEAEYCIKAVRKPLDQIRNNQDYNFYDNLEHGDSKIAASEYKQFLLQALKYQASNKETDEGTILYEGWRKIRVNENNTDELVKELKENDEDTKDLRQGEVLMRVVTWVDIVHDPCKVQLIRRSEYPFEIYQADLNPLEIYGESWIKHVIPMNRVLNALESSIFQYNYKYAKGRLVVDKNSGVRIVSNEHGDIIEKNQNGQVAALPLQPLQPSYELQINNMRRYIEDVGGAHDISFGRVPTGIKSGIGIAELKQADATNQGDYVDNLEDFLINVGKKVLKEIALNYDVPKLIRALGKDGKPQHFMIMGQNNKTRRNKKQVKIGTDVFNIAVIGAENEVNVKIGSWLAYTKEAQQDKLKDYFTSGLIDRQTFLEMSEFPNIKGIVDRVRMEKILEQYRGIPANEKGEITDEEIAEQENLMMTNENMPVKPMPEDNHHVHIVLHQQYSDNNLVSDHIEQHKQLLAANPGMVNMRNVQQGMGMQGQIQGQPPPIGQQGPLPPQGPPVGPAGPPPIPPPPSQIMGAASPEEAQLMQGLQGILG